MSTDNRPMAVLPRAQEPEPGQREGTVTLDLLPRVRYRVRLGSGDDAETRQAASPEIFMTSLCFDSGVLICPEVGAKSAVVVNLSDRITSLKSGSRYGCTAPQQAPRQQGNGAPRASAWRPTTSTSTAAESPPQSAAAASTASSS